MTTISAISLFSGIGAFELAAESVFGDCYQTFQFVEIDKNAQKVLRSHFPHIPIWSDIKTYHPPKPGFFSSPTVCIGGFPCKSTSNAGKREGLSGEESNLWWEMYRVILEFQPDFVIVENPEGLIHRGLQTIVGAFKLAGYQAEIELITAAELGAPHKRSRLFVIAHRNDLCIQQRERWQRWDEQIGKDIEKARQIVGYEQTQSSSVCLDVGLPSWLGGIGFDGWWKCNSPPPISGVKPRTPGRRECINLYGRSIVPIQAAIALFRLKFLINLLSSN